MPSVVPFASRGVTTTRIRPAMCIACVVCTSLSACKSNKAPSGATGAEASATPSAIAPPSAAARGAPGEGPGLAAAADAGAGAVYRCFRGPNTLFAVELRGGIVRALFYRGGLIELRGKAVDVTHFSVRQVKVPKDEKPVSIAGEWSADGKAFAATLNDPRQKKPVELRGTEGAFDKPGKGFKADFKGLLGKNFIRMRLEREGTQLRGVYRYARSAEDITLGGSVVDTDGSFSLTESVKGKVSGKFEGVLASTFGVLASWSSPDGSRSYPVELEPGDGYPETLDLVAGLTMYPQESVFQTKDCTADVLFPQIRGAKDKSKQEALNALLRGDRGTASPCDEMQTEPEGDLLPGASFHDEDYSVLTGKRRRFVSITQSTSFYFRGAAHPNGGSTCNVLDTQTLTLFRMVDVLTKEGRAALGDKVTEALQAGGPRLSEQNYYADQLEIGPDTSVCLTDSEIRVDFQRYEVAPYFMGAPSAAFPKADLRPLFEKGERMDAMFAQ